MTSADWGKSLIVAGVMVVITAAIMYTLWPDWADSRAMLTRLGSAALMGFTGFAAFALGILLVANGTR